MHFYFYLRAPPLSKQHNDNERLGFGVKKEEMRKRKGEFYKFKRSC